MGTHLYARPSRAVPPARFVDRDVDGSGGCCHRVADTLTALGDLAAWTPPSAVPAGGCAHRQRWEDHNQRDDCGHLRSRRASVSQQRVLKSEGNFNNLVGLPLTLLQLRGDEAVAVLEMG